MIYRSFYFLTAVLFLLSLPINAEIIKQGINNARITKTKVENNLLVEDLGANGNPQELFLVSRPNLTFFNNDSISTVESRDVFTRSDVKVAILDYSVHGYFLKVKLAIQDKTIPEGFRYDVFEFYAGEEQDKEKIEALIAKFEDVFADLKDKMVKANVTVEEEFEYREVKKPYVIVGESTTEDVPAGAKFATEWKVKVTVPEIKEVSFANFLRPTLNQWHEFHGHR